MMYYLGSMTPVRHHIRVSVFKCLLTVSVLAVFAVQLSYDCQRLPDAVGSAVGAGAGGTVADGTGAGGARHAGPKVHLCTDKRYALQPIFLLTCGRHRLVSVFPAGVHFCSIDSHPAIAMVSRLHSLRGPPQQMA
jgi:hypothetical protein